MQLIKTTAHMALLDDETGVGLLALPRPADDMNLNPLQPSLHYGDFEEAARIVELVGWRIVTGDFDLPEVGGHLPDGRPLVMVQPNTYLPSSLGDDEERIDAAHRLIVGRLAAA